MPILPQLELADLKEQFERDGYCVASDLFTEGQIAEIEAHFEEYKKGGVKLFEGNASAPFQDHVTYAEADPKKRQVRAMMPHRSDAKVQDWFLNPQVMDMLEHLLGRPAFGVQTMYYFKPPGAKGQGMHQDNFYLLSKPATCIAVWTAIDDADIENGCLYVVPKSHHSEILCPESGEKSPWMDYGDGHITKFPREAKPVPVPVKRGQTMIFGGNLIHGSGPNRTTDRFRRTFIGHYVDASTEAVSRYYHPVLDRNGTIVSQVEVRQGGGPCGDGWQGGTH